jgi:hypothetical protein
VAIQNGDLLAPRRQERQVRKFNFFAVFAGDIPSFGCGFAALGSMRLLFYVFASPHAFRITPAMLRPRIATIFFPVSALPDWGEPK